MMKLDTHIDDVNGGTAGNVLKVSKVKVMQTECCNGGGMDFGGLVSRLTCYNIRYY